MANILISLLEGELVGSTLDIIEETGGELEIHVRRVYVPVEIDIAEETGGDLTIGVRGIEVPAEIDVTENFGGELNITVRGEYDIDVREYDGGELNVQARLSLDYPPPIINEIPVNWLQHQSYQVRVTDDLGNDIKIQSASVRAGRDNLAEEATLTLSTADWQNHTAARRYTIEIGLRTTPLASLTWHTVMASGEVLQVDLGSGYTDGPDDTVSIGLVSTWQERLIGWRTQNLIVYDPLQTSVTIEASDTIYYENGTPVTNVLQAVPGLTLYKLLKIFYPKTKIVTNLPNFPISRADVPVTTGLYEVLSGIVRIFTPLMWYSADNDTLYILNKYQELPEDFTAEGLTADEYTNWQHVIRPQDIDGFFLIYTENIGNWVTTAERVVSLPDSIDALGNKQIRLATFRDWKDIDGKTIRTEQVRLETTIINAESEVLATGLIESEFDGQGKLVREVYTDGGYVAYFLGGSWVREWMPFRQQKETVIGYATYAGQEYQARRATVNKEIVVIDNDNTFRGNTYFQSYLQAFSSGNISEQTTVSGVMWTIDTEIEELTPIRPNQYRQAVQKINYLNGGDMVSSYSEVQGGNPAVNRTGGKRSKGIIILRDGLTPGGRANPVPKPLPALSVGELPLALARPLAKGILRATIEGRRNGTATLGGWHPAMQKGLIFNALDRADNAYGIFITEGWTISLENLGTPEQFVSTSLEIAQVEQAE